MNNRAKDFLKKFIPPILLELKNGTPKKYGFFGEYTTWEEAAKLTSRYSHDAIIDKVKSSALKVKHGEAVYERDSVVFNKIDVSWPLLAALLWISSLNKGALEVIDFGGSLGTSYYQNQGFLKHLSSLKWHIIEQDKFVEIGKKEFADSVLDFHYEKDLKTLAQEKKPSLLIVSSSLQFIPDPIAFLSSLPTLDIPYIIFDKIPFFTEPGASTKIMIQKVPPKIYDASYPVSIFGRNAFLELMKNHFELVSDFVAYDGVTQDTEHGPVQYQGFIFKKR